MNGSRVPCQEVLQQDWGSRPVWSQARTSVCGPFLLSSPTEAAITNHHRLDGLTKHSFLTVLEAGKVKVKMLADPVSGEGSPPGLLEAASVPTWWKTERGGTLFHVSSYKPQHGSAILVT